MGTIKIRAKEASGTRALLRKVLVLTLCIVFLISYTTLAAADTAKTSNKYNVVFVLDESGSMDSTDSQKLRYEAVDLFLGLMANDGNYVGTVSFDDGIINTHDISAVKSREDKKSISDEVKANCTKNKGDTDIGGALKTAVSMLQSNGNPDNPSVIVLLTDGKTDLDNNPGVESKEETQSLQNKAEAVDDAKNDGIRVFSVCLNQDGTAGEDGVKEAAQVAKATGGEWKEVQDAAGLQDVFKMFYGLIYGTDEITIVNGLIGADGLLKTNFEVPNSGVEEANILVQGTISDIKVFDPSDNEYKNMETTNTSAMTLAKVYAPEPGEWRIEVKGEPGTKISVKMLYNYSFDVTDNTDLADSYHKGESVQINATIVNMDGAVIGQNENSEYNVAVHLVNNKGKDTDTIAMKPADDGFTCNIDIPSEKSISYYIAAAYDADEKYGKVVKKTDIRQIVVDNTPPVSNGDVSVVLKKWPFKADPVYELDLTTLATDNEDAALEYEIIDSSFISKDEDPTGGDYSVENNVLKQTGFSLRKGSYTVRCTDSGGLYTDVKVTVSRVNVGVLALIGLGALVLLGLIILGILTYIALTRPFRGDIYMRNDIMESPEKKSPRRGRLKLQAFDLKPSHLNYSKCYFQATGRQYIVLHTDKVVYGPKGASKEIQIPSSVTETYVYLDEQHTRYFLVRFDSRVPGGRGGNTFGGYNRSSGKKKKGSTGGGSPFGSYNKPSGKSGPKKGRAGSFGNTGRKY